MLWLCFLKACHHRRPHPRSLSQTPLGGLPTPSSSSSSTFFTFLHQKHARTKQNKIQTLFIWVCVLRGMCVCGQQGSKGSNSYRPPHHTRTASTPFRPFKPPGSCTPQVLPCKQTDNGGKRRLWIRSLVTRDYEFSISSFVNVRIMCIASQRHGHGISMSFLLLFLSSKHLGLWLTDWIVTILICFIHPNLLPMVSLYCMFCIFRAQYIVTITTTPPPVIFLHRRPPMKVVGWSGRRVTSALGKDDDDCLALLYVFFRV